MRFPTVLSLTTLSCLWSLIYHDYLVAASGGSPFFRTHNAWGAAVSRRPRSVHPTSSRRLSPRSQKLIAEISARESATNELYSTSRFPSRGGQGADSFVKVVGTITNVLVLCGKMVLPPAVAIIQFIANIYQALPKDAIVAQVGLVYCFAGGYYPTLFSSLAAAQQCGWNIMVEAIQDLTDEAINVIHALEEVQTSKFGFDDDMRSRFRDWQRNTGVVLATIDPQKVNEAARALYMTWLGVSSVLEKEYARVIALSLTMAHFIERIALFILAPPARLCVAKDYHRWVPVVIEWGCKALAMNVAWRIQRVMTAATSAITGGLMFSRAAARMLSKRGIRLYGLIQEEDECTVFDEVIGFIVAGLGFYTQFEAQWRSGFSFKVPFPISLVTWPFDLAEKWIQWQITK